MVRELKIERLGRIPYAEALELQEKQVEAVRQGVAGDTLFLLEHPPVITLGRRADPAHVLVPTPELCAQGVELHTVTRGGDVTYHGPGQLVGYLVCDLAARGATDVHGFLRALEAGLIDALAALGLRAAARCGLTGVFMAEPVGAQPRKIASIGIGLRGWVTYHGFALNVSTRLSDFARIVPCGLSQVKMTSVACELGSAAPTAAELDARAREAVAVAFSARFG
jgi:lipoyl(octanoyl) transferase